MEKIVICDDSADYDVEATAYFFVLNKGKWKSLHSGGFSDPKTLEFLSSGKTGDFDIIIYSGEKKDSDGEKISFTGLWKFAEKFYTQTECRETKDDVEKIIPCPKLFN